MGFHAYEDIINLPLLWQTALTLKNFSQKNLPFYGKMRDNRIDPKTIFSHKP